jgi:F-type H+-transporting ATPase subunit delta
MLTRKNREPLLPAIAAEFSNAYNVHKGIQKASVATTFALDANMKKEMEELVRKISGKAQIDLEQKVDETLIGGFILNVGDKQIDASIKSKLKSLKTKFSENPYIKEF